MDGRPGPNDQGTPERTARRSALPRFSCLDCGRLIAATTPYPYALVGGGTYHYLRPHRGRDGQPCPGRAIVHPHRLAAALGGEEDGPDERRSAAGALREGG